MSIQDLKKAALVNSTHPHLLPPSLSSSMSPQMHPSTPAPERPRKGSPNPAGPTASEQPGRAHRGPGDTPGPLCGEAHARRYTVRRWRASLLRMARGAGQASTFPKWPGGKSARFLPGGGQGGLYKLEFLHFEFCTKSLYAICSVFLRICAGNNSKHPLFLMSNCWEPYIICSLILKKWHRFCRARICRFIFSPARNPPPPPGVSKKGWLQNPEYMLPTRSCFGSGKPAPGAWYVGAVAGPCGAGGAADLRDEDRAGASRWTSVPPSFLRPCGGAGGRLNGARVRFWTTRWSLAVVVVVVVVVWTKPILRC